MLTGYESWNFPTMNQTKLRWSCIIKEEFPFTKSVTLWALKSLSSAIQLPVTSWKYWKSQKCKSMYNKQGVIWGSIHKVDDSSPIEGKSSAKIPLKRSQRFRSNTRLETIVILVFMMNNKQKHHPHDIFNLFNQIISTQNKYMYTNMLSPHSSAAGKRLQSEQRRAPSESEIQPEIQPPSEI